MKRISVALIYLMSGLTGVTQAASVLTDTFDAGLGSWTGNTINTQVAHVNAGGNPGGYMVSSLITTSGFQIVGASNIAPDYSGDFADGIWTVSVDLNYLQGSFDDARLRFRDFSNPVGNGWSVSLEDTLFPQNQWNTYSVSFDTTWSDADAQANGWEPLAPTTTFAALFDNAWSSEIRISGDNRMVAGIDNYTVTTRPLPEVPVPAAFWLFGTALVGFVGISRRRRIGSA